MPSTMIELLILLGAAGYSMPRIVRAYPRVSAAAVGRSMDVFEVPEMRRQTSLGEDISPRCLNTLVAAANENGKLKKDNYFVFTDGMSNGYYTYYNMTSFSDLPFQNKYGFVTLACQCHKQGGSDNCCQGERAKLDVSGAIENPEDLDEELHAYVADICRVTMKSIGEDLLPATGELPATPDPTGSPAPSDGPTPAISATPSGSPSGSVGPSGSPSSSGQPSGSPSSSGRPTGSPSITALPTGAPSNWPSTFPIQSPTRSPTEAPTDSPTVSPTNAPITASPTMVRPLPVVETPPTDSPVVSPTESPITASPTITRPLPIVETPINDPDDQDDRKEGGLSAGAWSGIAAAGVVVLLAVLCLLCCCIKKEVRGKDLGGFPPQRSSGGTGGGMLAITNGGIGDGTASNTMDVERGIPISEGRQGRVGSPDGSDSITSASASSTVSSLPSAGPLAHVGMSERAMAGRSGSAVASQSGSAVADRGGGDLASQSGTAVASRHDPEAGLVPRPGEGAELVSSDAGDEVWVLPDRYGELDGVDAGASAANSPGGSMEGLEQAIQSGDWRAVRDAMVGQEKAPSRPGTGEGVKGGVQV